MGFGRKPCFLLVIIVRHWHFLPHAYKLKGNNEEGKLSGQHPTKGESLQKEFGH
jgi:hypothetical protein